MSDSTKTVIITGGSSGIGLALAREFLRRKYKVGITGRSADKLDAATKEILKDLGGTAVLETRVLEVTSYEDNFSVVADLTASLGGRLDILIANAGLGGSQPVGVAGFPGNRHVFESNTLGAIATLSIGADTMKKQKGGQLVGISSVAAWRGLAGNAAYCASKAALSSYLQGIRGELSRKNIVVTAIHPGYIDTPLNRSVKSRPFVITVEKGARIIAKRIVSKRRSATVPWFPWAMLGFLMRLFP